MRQNLYPKSQSFSNLQIPGIRMLVFAGMVILGNIFLISSAYAQNSNVAISAAATTGGTWSGGTTGPYTFTPNADNANIINTDIQNRLAGLSGFAAANVTIVTSNAVGTQAG